MTSFNSTSFNDRKSTLLHDYSYDSSGGLKEKSSDEAPLDRRARAVAISRFPPPVLAQEYHASPQSFSFPNRSNLQVLSSSSSRRSHSVGRKSNENESKSRETSPVNRAEMWAQRLSAIALQKLELSGDGPSTTSSESESTGPYRLSPASSPALSWQTAAPSLEIERLFQDIIDHDSSQQLLRNFLKKFPKGGELHTHLTGAIYSQDYIALAYNLQLFYDPEEMRFFKDNPDGKRIKTRDLCCEDPYSKVYEKLQHSMNTSGCVPGNALKAAHFFNACKIGESIAACVPVSDLLAKILRNAEQQNLAYLEVMVDFPCQEHMPEELEKAFKNSFDDALCVLKETGWLDKYVKTQKDKLDAWDKDVCSTLSWKASSVADSEAPVTTGYLAEIMRNREDDFQFFAEVAAAMALIQADSRVVGINVAGPEHSIVSIAHFDAQMKILKYLHSKFGGPNISLHAGELTEKLSSASSISNHITASIEHGKAKRIGHGVSIAHEDMHSTLALMKKAGVAVEICLTSNEIILSVAGKGHPITLYLLNDIPITLNTDDEGITCSDLTNEYMKAVECYRRQLSYDAIKKLARNSIQYSFLSGDSIFSDGGKYVFKDVFRRCSSRQWKPCQEAQEILKASKKAQVQLKLEKQFLIFEEEQLGASKNDGPDISEGTFQLN